MYDTIVEMKPIRFSRSARRHKIGKAHAYHVISSSEPTIVTDPQTNQPTLTWIADDSRQRELEIVAIETPDCFLVIHVMPTDLRKKGRKP
jgi:hypothetical protein